ncbi:hypothetical protein CAI18_15435 [Xanthomonas citri pv. punicae]|nr:hypothetical protein CAI14_05735 [Xanthomonas citri pv. punicae]QCZ67937.1 hypothetical protein CAI17_03380 [Xanthomonas citri pv. punicae]QCZ77636.1 hypothetical protein XapA_13460 [Xanthomonas citri pv. punicae]QCZ86196.1 hypothetical protein CAI18_15435 [Xanthomonas citri pv. punicae]CCF70405.1 hypothetical protein XAPC_4136 [Xanthomonas citri pv. punicae str. LMG 859]
MARHDWHRSSIAAYLAGDVLTATSQLPYTSAAFPHRQSIRNAQRRQICKRRKVGIPLQQARADTCPRCKNFCAGSLWCQWQTSLPILKPLKPLYYLDLEWWAVQGSNL